MNCIQNLGIPSDEKDCLKDIKDILLKDETFWTESFPSIKMSQYRPEILVINKYSINCFGLIHVKSLI